MIKTFVVTGASSGIGEGVAVYLKEQGHRVIGVARTNTDILTDLATKAGRKDLIGKVSELAPDGIDGIVTSAGCGDPERPDLVTALNYFGTTEAIEGLYPLLRKPGGRCVVITSVGQLQAGSATAELEKLCLAGDEDAAVGHARTMAPMHVYPASKHAVTMWARQTTVKPEWAGEGLAINIVAPGIVQTPMTERTQQDPELAAKVRKFSPRAVDEPTMPSDLAELIAFLLTFKTGHLLGQMIFLDGGSEAILRPDL